MSSALKLFLTCWMATTFPVAHAQAGDYVPTLNFDVASVRQSPEADGYRVSLSFVSDSSHFRATNVQISNLLEAAFGMRQGQKILNLPDWPWHAMFNVEAKSDSVADERLAKLNKDQAMLEQQHMMQVLLADRFKLRTHWETREGPVYDLVVTKKGPKMKEAKGEPPSPGDIKFWGDRPIPTLYQRGDSRRGFQYVAHGSSMEVITGMLAGQFGQPVIDKTGLNGKYDFILTYHDTRLADREADDMDPTPTLDVAIQDQLGLKLEPAKGPIQFLVIDHIEKPSEN